MNKAQNFFILARLVARLYNTLMDISLEFTLLLAATLLILSVVASKISDRFGVPALLVFLAVGMLAGSDGPGGIYFDDPDLALSIGTIALVVILFSGGLDTEWKSIRPVLRESLTLATLGTLITALITGLFAMLIFDLGWKEGFLLGSIVSSTDAAAVFSVLRSRGVKLRGNLKPLLELESGSNDPMAVFLTVGMIQLIQNPDQSILRLVPIFILQMLVGAAIGFLIGKLALLLINRIRLGYDGLYPVLTIALIFLSFSIAALLKGSGFLAVYITGLVLGQKEFLHKRSIIRFYNGTAWLMQITMFLTLGLLVFPSHLIPVMLPALALALALMLVARPISILLGTIGTQYTWREKGFISWVGLRGAVPIILAIYPKLFRLEQADLMFNVIFFVVLTSVLLQGTLIPAAARWMRVNARGAENPPNPLEAVPVRGWNGVLRELQIPAQSWVIGKAIYELALPLEYLIVLIGRDGSWFIPNGSIQLQEKDILLGLSSAEMEDEIEQIISASKKPESSRKLSTSDQPFTRDESK